MFAYLSKKIAIPGELKLRALAWNSANGWIACGGANGLLKVLKLESQARELAATQSGTAPHVGGKPASNLSMNQTLEGHQGDVIRVAWNSRYRKLTSADSRGKITVWMLYKGVWYEEMINNRNKSTVADLRWTPDGQRICIAYEDGMALVGSVDGNRIWGKELCKDQVRSMQWSPDGRSVLFATSKGELQKYDQSGNYLGKISFPSPVIAFEWYDGSEGYVEQGCPSLAVALEGGRVLLMNSDSDERQLAVNTGMKITCIQWSHSGAVLAIAGLQPGAGPEGKETSVVMFYTPFGQLERAIKVPGGPVTAMGWEGGGLRIALAVDSFIFFANIRPRYTWGYFDRTLVYSFTNAARREHSVMFWDTRNDEKHLKFVNRLLGVYCHGDRCVLVQRGDEEDGEAGSHSRGGGGGSSSSSTGLASRQQFGLIVCNAIGSPVDSKYIEVEPKFVAVTATHVIAANQAYFYAWNFQAEGADSSSRVLQRDQRVGRDVVRHIEDDADSGQGLNFKKDVSSDPICALAARNDIVVIARRGGTAHLFQLPAMRQLLRFQIGAYAQTLAINCDSTRLTMVDSQAVMMLYELRPADRETLSTPVTPGGRPLTGAEALARLSTPYSRDTATGSREQSTPGNRTPTPMRSTGPVRYTGKALPFERRDVWDLVWAEDNPDLLAVMEKTRMYIVRGLAPEENILSSGYLCQFKNLKVRAVMLDEVLRSPDKPEKEAMFGFETMSLRDSRAMVENAAISFEDCVDFISKHPHPRLWRALAEASLKRLDLAHAEKGFVRCGDYHGILFVKRLAVLGDPAKQKAEVLSYFKQFNEAESAYRDIDRRDLAIELRTHLGDWFRVVQLLQGAGGAGPADDALLARAWNEIGDYYSERRKYAQAVQFYMQAGNSQAIADCYTALEDYEALRQLVASTHEGDPLLLVLGERFQLVGMADAAVAAFVKGGDVKAAIDCCVHLNDWDRGIELAERNKGVPQIEGLLQQYASHLLSKRRVVQAVQLYRKAGLHTESAKLLFQLARQQKLAYRSKQLCILAALEVEKYRKKLQEQQSERAAAEAAAGASSDLAMARATLDGLMADAATTSKDKTLEIGWRGTEAYHFLMLAHTQLYRGAVNAAMCTALRLAEYEDILDPVEIHSLIALTSYYNKHYRQCSRAFARLETLDSLPQERRQRYQDLAFEIFVRHPPVDPDTKRVAKCRACDATVREWQPSCPQCGVQFPACVSTGRPIFDNKFFNCRTCKHPICESEASKVRICPLCHSLV